MTHITTQSRAVKQKSPSIWEVVGYFGKGAALVVAIFLLTTFVAIAITHLGILLDSQAIP